MALQGPDDIRLRRVLDDGLQPPCLADGFSLRTLQHGDETAIHELLRDVFSDEEPSFEAWWARLSSDAEFDPALCFLAFDPAGRLVAVAQCWTSAFVKDLAVAPSARRQGLAEALMWHVFAAFKERGERHVDLKTSTVENADAVRLYRRLGMVEVDWAG